MFTLSPVVKIERKFSLGSVAASRCPYVGLEEMEYLLQVVLVRITKLEGMFLIRGNV